MPLYNLNDGLVAGSYRLLFESATQLSTAAAAATNYAISPAAANSVAAGAPSNLGPAVYPIDVAAAEWAVGSVPTKLNLAVIIGVAATAPAVTYTFTLNAITIAAGLIVVGSAASGSTVTMATPGSNAYTKANSGDFAIPADGNYMVVATVSGTPSGNVGVKTRLRVRNA